MVTRSYTTKMLDEVEVGDFVATQLPYSYWWELAEVVRTTKKYVIAVVSEFETVYINKRSGKRVGEVEYWQHCSNPEEVRASNEEIRQDIERRSRHL